MLPGLTYLEAWIDEKTQENLLSTIDQQAWSNELKRRVQHYGYRYDYQARNLDPKQRLGDLPEWLALVCQRLQSEVFQGSPPEQVIINEYQPGQGIAAHIDRMSFGPIICSLSLGSGCEMLFSKQSESSRLSLYLQPRSLLILSGKARQEWRHQIPARKNDKMGELSIPRKRRISLTFRTLTK
jgi:alkylated DNA repair dioxygenase AlkB